MIDETEQMSGKRLRTYNARKDQGKALITPMTAPPDEKWLVELDDAPPKRVRKETAPSSKLADIGRCSGTCFENRDPEADAALCFDHGEPCVLEPGHLKWNVWHECKTCVEGWSGSAANKRWSGSASASGSRYFDS